jgi:hypothetical protein
VSGAAVPVHDSCFVVYVFCNRTGHQLPTSMLHRHLFDHPIEALMTIDSSCHAVSKFSERSGLLNSLLGGRPTNRLTQLHRILIMLRYTATLLALKQALLGS